VGLVAARWVTLALQGLVDQSRIFRGYEGRRLHNKKLCEMKGILDNHLENVRGSLWAKFVKTDI
jgi:hypothetical protein